MSKPKNYYDEKTHEIMLKGFHITYAICCIVWAICAFIKYVK